MVVAPATPSWAAAPGRLHAATEYKWTVDALRDATFDGIAAVCVFGWEEDADAIHRRMLDRVTFELAGPARESR
jgi:hypothetical protein